MIKGKIGKSITTRNDKGKIGKSIFLFIVSGSERTYIFRVALNVQPTLSELVGDIITCKQFTR